MVRRLALESGFYFDPTLVAAWEIYPESLSARSALSVAENTKLIGRAVAAVKATFPADISESYARRLERRLRFNMARLWLVFHKQAIDTVGLSEVLQFKGLARTGLGIAARLPFARLTVLAWTALVLRPYSIGAVLAAVGARSRRDASNFGDCARSLLGCAAPACMRRPAFHDSAVRTRARERLHADAHGQNRSFTSPPAQKRVSVQRYWRRMPG